MTPRQFHMVRVLTLKWSVNEMAEALRVSNREVRRWEDGDRDVPGPVQVCVEGFIDKRFNA
jgi:DNA-binding transcriptional regulator YiaG